MLKKLPSSFNNPITLAGGAIAAVSFGLILYLMVLEYLAEAPKPYMGIIAFVMLPTIMIGGLAIAAFGVWREYQRQRAGKSPGRILPHLDLNDPRHWTAFALVSAGGVLLLVFSAIGSFKAYEHTDSDQFCGQTCHSVMSPEYTAYQGSPHARVGCVKCHIGPGAGWFVRAKLSGSYQLYATLFNKYPRPIPTPIMNLRPAQETCEQCHWPQHFYSEKKVSSTYFMASEKPEKWTLDLLMRIGGGNAEAGPTSGIHWHMNINNKVTYVATDSVRQVIPWIRSEQPNGQVTVYKSTEDSLSDADLQRIPPRRMDCIDCHNRPSHIYRPPARSVNHLMTLGWIDPTLPNSKSTAVEALEANYSTAEVALDSIKVSIENYYAKNYPAVATAKKTEIARMVAEVQKVYSRSYFPAMKVSWKRFPDNIGHMYYKGCFRCHDGKHVSSDGKVLSRECNTCHIILSQQFEKDSARVSLKGVEYRHPVDIGDAWKETNCSDCHSPSVE